MNNQQPVPLSTKRSVVALSTLLDAIDTTHTPFPKAAAIKVGSTYAYSMLAQHYAPLSKYPSLLSLYNYIHYTYGDKVMIHIDI